MGNLARHLVRASVLGARLHAAKFLGSAAWWSVVVFGMLAALVQLGIAVSIINTVITGLIAMVFWLEVWLSALEEKDYAAYLLGELRNEIEHHQ